MGTPAWAMPEAGERHTIMGAPAWVMPEAGERHTEQHPIKQHNAMGALPWAHLYGNTKQHPIMGTPAWDELQYSAIIL